MAPIQDVKEHVQALQTAVREQDEAGILTELRTLKEIVEPGEEVLRATKAGVAVGKLRTHETPEIADLAKSIVKTWKEGVEESKKRKAESQDAEGGGGEGSKKKSRGDDGRTASGSASPKKASSSLKRTDSSTSSDKPSSSRPVAPLPKANPPPTSSSSKAPPKLKPEPNFVKRASAAPASPSPPPTSGKEEVNPALPTIVLPYPAKPRTHAGDKAANAGTGENLRDKSVELIYNSLAGDSRADRGVLLDKSKLIEKGFFNSVGSKTDDLYRSKIRSIILNLKDKTNPALRDSIVQGDLDALGLCNLSKEDMASESLKASNKAMETENLFNSRGAVEIAAETDQFKCGKCGKRKTTYYQMQTRSADEPMTTFVTCLSCNNRWKFS